MSRILHWDLENTPLLGYAWSTYQTDIIHVVEPQRVMCWAAWWDDDPKSKVEFRSTFHDGRRAMLERIAELLDQADAAVTYNGARHDSPHITTEFLREGIEIPSPYREIDLYKVARGKLKLPNNRFNTVLHEFDLGAKVKHEGFPLWLKCMAGDEAAWARMRRYCIGDVLNLKPAYRLFRPIIPQSMHPNENLYCDGEVCPICGSSKIQRRGVTPTTVSLFPRFHCQSCGKWSRGKTAVERADVRGAS